MIEGIHHTHFSQRWAHLFLFIFMGLVYVEFPETQLFDPDETRYAEVSRQMKETGNYVTPQLNGSIYLEKPPLLYWLNAGIFYAFGESSYSARLVARLSHTGVIGLLYGVGGVWPALVYAMAFLPFALARVNITDGLLTATLSLCLMSIFQWIRQDEKNHPFDRGLLRVSIGVGAALAMLAKGLIGLVIPGIILFLWSGRFRTLHLIRQFVFSRATPIFFFIMLPWFVLVQKANPEFFQFFFIREHFQRFTSTVHERNQPVWFFFMTLLWGFLPWTFLFMTSIKTKLKEWWASPSQAFLLIWVGVVLVFFSLSKSKLIPYILPVFPALALLMGEEYRQWFHVHQKKVTFVSAVTLVGACFYLLAVVQLGFRSSGYSARGLIDKAVQQGVDQVVSYHDFFPSLPWTLRRSVPVVQFKGELASIGPLDPHLFWSEQQFWSHWSGGSPLCAIVRRKHQVEFFKNPIGPTFIWMSNRRQHLICNIPDQQSQPK